MLNIKEEINKINNLKVSELESKVQTDIKDIIKEINGKTSLSWAEARAYPNRIKTRLEKIVVELQEGIDKANEKAGQTTKLQNELREKNKSLQAEKEQLELLLQQAQDQTKTSEELQGELTKKEKASSELQQELTTVQKEAERLRQEIAALEKKIANDPEKKALKEQLVGKQKQLVDTEANVKILEEKRNDLDKEVSRLQTALINRNKEESPKIAGLQKQVVGLQGQLATEQAELSQVKKENFELKNELEAVQKQLTDLLIEKSNPLPMMNLEETKAIMIKYLELASKEKKNHENYLTTKTFRTKEKLEIEEEVKKLEEGIKKVQQVIEKLTDSSSQQLTAQIELNKK